MKPPESRTEETIFSTALQYSPTERASYLEQACTGDPALRERIENLLNAQPQVGNFMEDQSNGGAPGRQQAVRFVLPSEEALGTRIGRYKLLQKLGEGGCGVVYMAEQEEPVRRRVALKVIKLGMDTKSVVARFEAERQALAMMDHPNIAKVLDAGATETGRPYFVMELVRGVKITEFCDQNRLSTRERLDLFIQVCQAVQHAHQKGIIHRDLKPSNILVTIHDPGAPGVPMIIDFGIAKATQGRLTDQTLFTAFEQFLGTPAYMSPEQTLMTVLDVDTRSDIYSLGVLLYELLTGSTPFNSRELLAAGLEEMRRTIREKEPPRPSTRLSTLLAGEQATAARYRQTELPRLIHLVRGDLDWIVMKCLEKDRARRYETANALAMDLQRHLSNEPITARPPSRLYEFQKTVRRHKFGFAATALVMAALAVGIVGSLWQASRAGRAEREQRRLTQDAELHAYMSDMNLAHQALLEGDLGRARELLRIHIPKPGAPDPRNWEWRYLASECRGDELFALAGHSYYVSNVRFKDENTLLTTGIWDYRTVFHNLQERRPAAVITNEDHGGGIGLLAPAFKRGVAYYRPSWGASPLVRTLNLQSGSDAEFCMTAGRVAAMDLSPNEDLLAIASGSSVELWNVVSTPEKLTPVNAPSQVNAVAFSPDSRWLAMGLGDPAGTLVFHDLTSRHESRPADVPPNGGASLCFFSPDGRWFGWGGELAPLIILDGKDRSLAKVLNDTARTEHAAFSPNGQWLATVGGDASVRLWDTTTWQIKFKLKGHSDPAIRVAFSPSGRILVTASRNGEVKAWAVAEPPRRSESVEFSGSLMVDVVRDGSAFWRVTEAERSIRGAREAVRVIAGEMWSAATMAPSGTLDVGDLFIPGPAADVSPGGQTFAVGDVDNTVHFRRVGDQADIARDKAGQNLLNSVVMSLDGSVLASLSYYGDWGIRAWRLPGMKLLGERKDIPDVHRICLSDDGKSLAVLTGRGCIGVLAVPSLKGPPPWKAVDEVSNWSGCAFSPDGRRLATAMSGHTYIWDLASHRRIALPRTLSSYSSLSFSPDGTRLLASDEKATRMFDTATGQQVFSLNEAGLKVAFTRDGQGLLAVRLERAFLLHAPALDQLQFDWLAEPSGSRPSEARSHSDHQLHPRTGTKAASRQ